MISTKSKFMVELEADLRWLAALGCQYHSPSNCFENSKGAVCNSCQVRVFAEKTLEKLNTLRGKK